MDTGSSCLTEIKSKRPSLPPICDLWFVEPAIVSSQKNDYFYLDLFYRHNGNICTGVHGNSMGYIGVAGNKQVIQEYFSISCKDCFEQKIILTLQVISRKFCECFP